MVAKCDGKRCVVSAVAAFSLCYEESPGNHQWKYWDEKIQTVLDWLIPADGKEEA